MRLAAFALLLAACGDNVIPDPPHLVVTAGDVLRTTEAGGTATFTVGFDVPTAMMITLTSTNGDEGTVSPSMVTLAPTDIEGARITITGVDDSLLDGNQAYSIHVDAGPLGEQDVAATNEDNEGASGIMVTPLTGMTTEAGGTAMFTVVLAAQPTADVTIPLASSNVGEGTLSAVQLVFTPLDWNVAQTVTVTGQNDAIDDGDKPYDVLLGTVASGDPRYAGVNPPDVMMTNTDDDQRGFIVAAISGMTNESGTMATFTVVLTSEPTADVTVGVMSGDTTEGSVMPTSITFTPLNWMMPKTITVTGVDDTIVDGNITYSIILMPATSNDPDYNGLNPTDALVTNVDND